MQRLNPYAASGSSVNDRDSPGLRSESPVKRTFSRAQDFSFQNRQEEFNATHTR